MSGTLSGSEKSTPLDRVKKSIRGWIFPEWMDRNMAIVMAARGSISVARALAGVVVPIYLAIQGFSAFKLGILFLAVALTSAVLSSLIGLLSDRIGRRPFLIVLPLFAAVAGLVFAYSDSTLFIFIAASLGSFGRGAGAGAGAVGPYQPAESAFVTDATTPRWRNSIFGRLAFMSSVGALAGGLFALLVGKVNVAGAAGAASGSRGSGAGGAARASGVSGVARSSAGTTAHSATSLHSATRVAAIHAATMSTFRPAFIAASAFAALAGIIAIWISEQRHSVNSGSVATAGAVSAADADDTDDVASATGAAVISNNAGKNGVGSKRKVRFPYHSRSVLYRLWSTNTVNGFAIGMFGPFIAYWFYRRFGVGAGEVGVLFAAINFVTAFSSLSAAGLARRYGLVRTMTVVRLIQAVLLIPMVLVSSFELAGAIYLIRMVVQRIAMPLRQSYVLAMAHPEERASLAALSNVPSQFAMAASPTLAGYIFDNISLSLPFELTGFLQLVNAGMFWGFFHNMPPPEEEAAALLVQEE
jgi:MFS family permease